MRLRLHLRMSRICLDKWAAPSQRQHQRYNEQAGDESEIAHH
jgi:hypothetical protein